MADNKKNVWHSEGPAIPEWVTNKVTSQRTELGTDTILVV